MERGEGAGRPLENAQQLRKDFLRPSSKQVYIRLLKGGDYFDPEVPLTVENTGSVLGHAPFATLQEEWEEERQKVQRSLASWSLSAARATTRLVANAEAPVGEVLRVAFAGWGIPLEKNASQEEIAQGFASNFYQEYCGEDTANGMAHMATSLLAAFQEKNSGVPQNQKKAQMEKEVLLVLEGMHGWLRRFYGSAELEQAFVACVKAELALANNHLQKIGRDVLSAKLSEEQKTILNTCARHESVPAEQEVSVDPVTGVSEPSFAADDVAGESETTQPASLSSSSELSVVEAESDATSEASDIPLTLVPNTQDFFASELSKEQAQELDSPHTDASSDTSTEANEFPENTWLLHQEPERVAETEQPGESGEQPHFEELAPEVASLLAVPFFPEVPEPLSEEEELVMLKHEKLGAYFEIRKKLFAVIQSLQGKGGMVDLEWLADKMGMNIAILAAQIDMISKEASPAISEQLDVLMEQSRFFEGLEQTEIFDTNFLRWAATQELHTLLKEALLRLTAEDTSNILPPTWQKVRMSQKEIRSLLTGVLEATGPSLTGNYAEEWVEGIDEMPLFGDQLYFLMTHHPVLQQLYQTLRQEKLFANLERVKEKSAQDKRFALGRRTAPAEVIPDDSDDLFVPPLAEVKNESYVEPDWSRMI